MRFLLTSGTAFFAGALSLVSQIIGLRIVARELSASELTVASVLVCALCGLSLGALITGRFADRRRSKHPSDDAGIEQSKQGTLTLGNALLAFAAIAVLLLALTGSALAGWLASGDGEAIQVLGFLLVTVFPINVLLGGIVPVLTKAMMGSSVDDVQSAFGWVYAWETFGAAVGAWVVVFVAVPSLGAKTSLLVTATIVLAWTALNLLLGNRRTGQVATKTESVDAKSQEIPAAEQPNLPMAEGVGLPANDQTQHTASGLRWLLLFAALASSSASLGMELVWQRYFAVVFGSDSHSYAVVATVFLIGNSIGALLASRIFRVRAASRRLYQWQLLLVGGSILVSVWSLGIWFRLETLQWTLGWIKQAPLSGRLAMAVAVLLLPAIMIGTALPVLVKIWSTEEASLGKQAGQIYGCVIVGNVVGILVCACWLIPTFGLQVTAICLASICVAASIGIFLLAGIRSRSKRSAGSVLLSTGYWAIVAGMVWLASLIFNSPVRPGLSDSGDWVVDHYIEQATHTVAVLHAADLPSNKRLVIDGVTIGESGGGVDEKQQVLAHLPFLIGDAKRSNVLTIGLGTGILAGELSANDQVESLSCVELSSAVIEASQWFAAENREVLSQSKFQLVHGDGVRYLRTASDDFDVIVSDGKSRPGAATNLPFFSEDYYRICADALSEDGVFVQWVSLRCDQREMETILKTFCGKFPFGHVAVAAPDSVYLVGTRSPISFRPTAIEQRLLDNSTQTLKSYGWASADDVLTMYWLDQTVIQSALADVVPNTFDRPVLENFAWSSYGHSVTRQQSQLPLIQRLIDGDKQSMFNGQPLSESEFEQTAKLVATGRQATGELMAAESIVFAGQDDWLDQSTVHYKKAMKLLPQMNRQRHIVGSFRSLAAQANLDQDVSTEFSALLNIAELKGAMPEDEYRMGQILVGQNRGDLALDHFYQAVKLSDRHPRYLIGFGKALLLENKVSAAFGQFERAIRAIESTGDDSGFSDDLKPRAKLFKGIALLKLGRSADGQKIVNEVLKSHPKLQEVYFQFSR